MRTFARRVLPALALLALVLVAVRCVSGPSAQELEQIRGALAAPGTRLVDVRTPGEYGEGHLAGARNLPVGELEGRLQELEPKGEPVVVYCRSGMRSGRAARLLRERGWTRVHDLGGIGNGASVALVTTTAR
ncbi:MAG: rhodanese-like domain-containing protein [Planctomycetota bacterium]